MTQEILYCTPQGIVLASDSLVVHIAEDGQRRHYARKKLFPLGKWAALVTAGAYIGIDISRRFSALAQDEGLVDLERLLPAAQSFFEQAYERFIHLNRSWFAAHPLAYRSLYLLLVGRGDRHKDGWQAHLLSSEEHQLPFQRTSIGEILTIPRRLGIEGQLMARLKTGRSLEDVAAFCDTALSVLAERDPEQVGAPFQVAILDQQGFRWWEQPCGEAL
jgi:hypothetical protein